MMMSKSAALVAVTNLEILCQDFGFANERSKCEMVKIVHSLRSDGPEDSYYREKLFNIEMWAKIGFNTRKSKEFQGGASQLTVFALGDCSTLRNLIQEYWPHE